MHTTPVQFSYSTPPLTAITATPQITAGQGSVTAALSMPTDQWIALPEAIWPFIFTKVATASDLLNLRSTCHYLHNVYASISKLDERQRQHDTLIYNLTTPRLHQQLYNKVINRNWGKIALPDKDTEEWTKLLAQPLDPKLRGEDYGVAVIKKLCIVGWDLLLSPQVMNNRLLVAGLMRLLVDLSRHIRYPEEYVDKLFPEGFDEELFHQLAHIHVDRCIQLVTKYFPFQEHSAAYAFTLEQLRLMGVKGDSRFFIGIKVGAFPSTLFYMVLCIAREEFNTLLRHLAPDCDLEQRHSGGATALLFASYVHEEELILPFIRHGANYNTADDKGHTPLMGLCANEGGNLELVNYFSKLPNINVNAEDSKGRTALHRAAHSSKPSVLKELLNFPTIDVNARTHKGLGAIDYAIDYQQLSNLQILLRNPKCDINTTLYLPASRLYFAIEHNLLSQIKTLLSRPHKDPDIRLSAFNYAIWQQKDAIAAMFLQDMDKQAQHDFIKQALALAWERGQREIRLSLYQTYGTQYGIALPPQEELEEFTYDVAPEFNEWLEMEELLINNYSED